MPRPSRIMLTAAGEGFLYEKPRLQALARLQPIRVHVNGRVRDDVLSRIVERADLDGTVLRLRKFGGVRPITSDHFTRLRWLRRRYGSHAKTILRQAEARRRGL